MIVRAVVLCRYGAAELPAAHLVRGFSLNGAVTACAQLDIGVHTILPGLTSDDVHHAPHGIATIEHTRRAAKHLHTFGHQRLIAVGDGMAVDALILRMTVNEHQQLSCTT